MEPEKKPSSELRTEILRHASRLFAEQGYRATSVREVAEACGCTKPALYYHFANKEALYLECLDASARRILALEAALEPDRPVPERLRCGLTLFFEHVARHPLGMRLLMRAELRPEPGQPAYDFEAMRTHHLGRIQELLAEGVARGELRADLDLDDAACALKGMVDQRLQMWLHGTPIPPDAAGRVLSIFLHGVAKR